MRGIAKIGSYVNPGDILVSKLAPKEQRAMSAEEELLQASSEKSRKKCRIQACVCRTAPAAESSTCASSHLKPRLN